MISSLEAREEPFVSVVLCEEVSLSGIAKSRAVAARAIKPNNGKRRDVQQEPIVFMSL